MRPESSEVSSTNVAAPYQPRKGDGTRRSPGDERDGHEVAGRRGRAGDDHGFQRLRPQDHPTGCAPIPRQLERRATSRREQQCEHGDRADRQRERADDGDREDGFDDARRARYPSTQGQQPGSQDQRAGVPRPEGRRRVLGCHPAQVVGQRLDRIGLGARGLHEARHSIRNGNPDAAMSASASEATRPVANATGRSAVPPIRARRRLVTEPCVRLGSATTYVPTITASASIGLDRRSGTSSSS